MLTHPGPRLSRRRLLMLNRAGHWTTCACRRAIGWKHLKGKRGGQHSIRVNDQFRACFVWTAEGPEDVQIADYH